MFYSGNVDLIIVMDYSRKPYSNNVIIAFELKN